MRGGGFDGWETVIAEGRLGGSKGSDLYPSACAGAGGHEKGGLVVGGWDGDALGLVGLTASCCLLRSG